MPLSREPPSSPLDECSQRSRSILYGKLSPGKIEVALAAGCDMERSITPYLHLFERACPEHHMLTAAARICGVAVITSRTIWSNGDEADTEGISGAMAVLHRKLLRLGLQFGLTPLFFLLLGELLLFLLNVGLQLSKFGVFGEKTG